MDWIRCPIEFHQNSDAIAIWTQDLQLTYRELNQLVARLAATPLPPDRPIAFIESQSVETIAWFFALWRRQKLVLPLSARWPEQSIKKALQLTKATLVHPILSSEEHNSSLLNLSILSTLLFTSGTTGIPKIACHTLRNHFYSAQGAISLLDLQPGDCYLLDLPLNHVGGLAVLLRTFLAGATLLLKPSPIEPTHISLVPTQLMRILRNGSWPKRAKCLLIGGAPISPPLVKEALHYELPLYHSYGMTETSSMILLRDLKKGITSILPQAEISIHKGEIYVRGPMLFQGYYRLENPPEIPLADGWFATGDLGRITSDGTIECLKRKDRQFISGGENIQPEEIEAQLLQYPGITEAYVRPIIDKEFGLRVSALLICEKEMDCSDIERELRTHLPGYKIPKEWKIQIP